MEYKGSYFDGKQSKPHAVSILPESEGVIITLDSTGEQVIWFYNKIDKYQEQGGVTTVYYGDKIPYASISVDDSSFLEAMELYGKEARFLKDIHRVFERIGVAGYAGALLGVALFLLLCNYIILPGLENIASRNVPISVEKNWGDEFFHTFSQFNDIDVAASKYLTEFAEELNFETDYDLQFYVVESDVLNAFALPGGRIVVFTGILDTMQHYSELVALLGHEVGHVNHRHSLKNIFHQYSHQYLLKLLFGNGTDVLGSIGQSVSQLSLMKNSREAETQADEYGLMVLRRNDVNPQGMINLFRALAADELSDTSKFSKTDKALEMISTHPNMENRIAKITSDIDSQVSYVYQYNSLLSTLFSEMKKD